MPVSTWRENGRAVVLMLMRRNDDTVHALVAVATREKSEEWLVYGDAGASWVNDVPSPPLQLELALETRCRVAPASEADGRNNRVYCGAPRGKSRHLAA